MAGLDDRGGGELLQGKSYVVEGLREQDRDRCMELLNEGMVRLG